MVVIKCMSSSSRNRVEAAKTIILPLVTADGTAPTVSEVGHILFYAALGSMQTGSLEGDAATLFATSGFRYIKFPRGRRQRAHFRFQHLRRWLFRGYSARAATHKRKPSKYRPTHRAEGAQRHGYAAAATWCVIASLSLAVAAWRLALPFRRGISHPRDGSGGRRRRT